MLADDLPADAARPVVPGQADEDPARSVGEETGLGVDVAVHPLDRNHPVSGPQGAALPVERLDEDAELRRVRERAEVGGEDAARR
jgi:hypothetical protein